MERLQKVIAQSGYCSRRKAEELIAAGKVTVNGETITEMGVKVKHEDVITVEGNPLTSENKVYYMVYKPKNMVCTVKDEHDRSCIIDLFPEVEERIYPIGRLDYDSTGLILMTNDGEFANLLMHPSSHLEKVYDITIRGDLSDDDIKRLERGVYLEGVKTLPCEIEIVHRDIEHNVTRLKIRLVEGKNRQIRKMFDIVGYEVIRLHREAIGPVRLHGMVPGETRRMKPHEVKELRTLALQRKEENKGFKKPDPSISSFSEERRENKSPENRSEHRFSNNKNKNRSYENRNEHRSSNNRDTAKTSEHRSANRFSNNRNTNRTSDNRNTSRSSNYRGTNRSSKPRYGSKSKESE